MKLVRDAAKSDYPDYKIINITTAGFPLFKKSVVCLATLQKGLPVVMDFTLKLLNLGLNKNQISKLLSIDEVLINNAFYDLERNNMYDAKLNKLTDDGRKYISTNKYESLQRVELPIIVDGYSGYISKSRNHISNRSAKSLNLNTLEPILDKYNNNSIQGRYIKQILKEYITENNLDYEGELVEIVKVINKETEYVKMYIVVMESPDGRCKLVVYDKNTKIDYLESQLYSAEEIGIKFFADKTIDLFLNNINENENFDLSEEEEIHDILDSNFFNNDYNQIYFDIPMIEAYKINDEWIKDLERYLKRRLNVKIRFNGSKYPTTYIKNRVFDIIMLSQKYKNLELEHSINYEYAKVIFDKNSGYIDKISKYNLPLINNSSCITHKFFKVNNVPSELFKQSNASGNVKFISSNTELKQITKNIIESAKSLDIEMENYYGIGWLDNGEFLNEHNFANLKLASNNKNFSDFTRNLNASMVEVIERVGTNNQINKYYYNEFQTNYPDLFYALDRLKVYRNSMQHNDLNSHTLEKYLKYIETDLGGSFPEFLPNGYLILQSVILNDIYSAIKKTSGALRKVLL